MTCADLLQLEIKQKPIGGRLLVAAALGVIVAVWQPSPLQAQPSALEITEKQAVQRALEQTDLTREWGATVTEARASAISEGAWPNPTLSYSHEQSYEEPDAVGEDFVIVEQTLPISGRRGLRESAARQRAEATRHRVTAHMVEVASQVRRAYYAVLHRQRRIDARTRWLDEMKALESKLARRVEAGESAAYDLERVRSEAAGIVADIEVDRAELARSRAELRGLLYVSEKDGPVTPRDTLMPAGIPSDEALDQAVDARPEVAAAREHVEAARLTEKAASRWWVPEPTVRAGYRGATVADEHFPGFVAGISLSLPIFSQSGGERLAAQAALERTRSRYNHLRRRYRANVRGLAAQTRRLIAAAQTYRTDGVARSKRVVEVALVSYDAGEVGILELLDAYRGLVQAELRSLELANKARGHEIELRENLGRPNVEQTPVEGE